MTNSSRYFCNKECEYFPCHPGADPEHFNCLFCYCPMNPFPDCLGHPEYIVLADGSKIKDGTITNDKISSIHGSKIENGTIDNEKISTINGSKIENGTINGEKISSISGSKIETGTITEDKLSEDAKNALFSQKQITLTLGGDLKSNSVALLFGQSNTISATVANINDKYINDLFK